MTEFPKKNLRPIQNELRRLTASLKPFWVTFDQYCQNKDRSVYASFQRSRSIVHLQKTIIQSLNPLREGFMRPKDLARFKQFSQQKQKNLRRYGTGRVFSQFQPHLNFSRLQQIDKKIVDLLPIIKLSFLVKEIGIFQSGEHGTCKKMLAKFRFSKA